MTLPFYVNGRRPQYFGINGNLFSLSEIWKLEMDQILVPHEVGAHSGPANVENSIFVKIYFFDPFALARQS